MDTHKTKHTDTNIKHKFSKSVFNTQSTMTVVSVQGVFFKGRRNHRARKHEMNTDFFKYKDEFTVSVSQFETKVKMIKR